MVQFQWKINKKAESLELHMWKIITLFDEDHNFGVEGITKELGTLKEKISKAITQFESMIIAFDKQQSYHFFKLMEAIQLLLNEMILKS